VNVVDVSGIYDVSYSVSGLNGNSNYDVSFITVNATGSSEVASDSVLTKPDTPAFTVNTITNSGFQLSFVLPPTDASYSLYVYDVSNSVNVVDVSGIYDVSYSVTGLNANSLYDISFLTVNATGSSEVASDSVLTIPDTPTFTVTAVTNSGFELSFALPPTDASYSLYVYDVSNSVSVVDVSGIYDVSYSVSGLIANSLYDVSLVTVIASGPTGVASDSVLTKPDTPAFTVATVTNSGFELSFALPPTDASYSLYVYDVSNSVNVVDVSGIYDVSYSVSGLTANSLYDISFLTVNATGSSEAASDNVLTKPDTPAFTVTAVTNSGFDLAFVLPPTDASYSLYVYDVSNSVSVVDVSGIYDISYSVSGLTANSLYDISFLTVNATGSSEAASDNVLTKPDTPAFTVTTVSNSSFDLTFVLPPTDASYSLYVYDVSNSVNVVDVSGIYDVSYSVSGLTSNSLYDVSFLTVNATGSSGVASDSVLTIPSNPLITHNSPNDNEIDITFNIFPVDGLTYNLTATNQNSVLFDTCSNIVVNPYVLSGTDPFDTYTVVVSATNTTGTSGTTTLKVPGKPTYTYDVTGATTFNVTFTSDLDTNLVFNLVVFDNAMTQIYSAQITDQNPHTISGLTANTSYTIYANATYTDTGANGLYNITTIKTAPSAPTGFAITSTSLDSINIAFDAPPTGVTYTLDVQGPSVPAYYQNDISGITSIVVNNTNSINPLTPNTTYSVYLTAINLYAASTSLQLTAITDPTTPTSLVVTSSTTSSILIGFNAPNTGCTYTVKLYDSSANLLNTYTGRTGTSYNITGLTSNTSYIIGLTQVISGEFSGEQQVNGLTKPDAPTNISTTATTPALAFVSFDAPVAGTTYDISAVNVATSAVVYSTTGVTGTTATITGLQALTTYNIYLFARNDAGVSDSIYSEAITKANAIPCFLEGSQILCLNSKGEQEYIPIEKIRPGVPVKTLKDGFVKVDMIGVSTTKNAPMDITHDRVYRLSTEKYPELFEDLYLTGWHAVLVDKLTDVQKAKTRQIFGKLYCTEGKFRLLSCLDERAELLELPGDYNIYHIALENPDYYSNYGILANGLLVETCSKRYLKEHSGMTLLQ
jgi:hypothetical protein